MTTLSQNEKDEMKALQDERKATEGHISDSRRMRLSELLNKEREDKAAAKEEKKELSAPAPDRTTTATFKK